LSSIQRFLTVYSAIVTLLFCGTAIYAVRHLAGGSQTIDVLNVHRINLREQDGTLRMVMANTDHFPGAIVKGVEYPHPRDTAGMLFYDNEGTEDGGLIFGGEKGPHAAHPDSYVHLSFDQYMQDQALALDEGQEDGQKFSRININDVGDYPITDAIAAEGRISQLPKAQQAAAWGAFQKTHPGNVNRIRLGRLEDKSVVVQMKDPSGKTRIAMMVAADGTPSLAFLDENGKVVDRLPTTKPRK
jgi:hypothetical protein